METCPVIAELNPAGNIFSCFLPCRVDGAMDQLNLQSAVDRFSESIIPRRQLRPIPFLRSESCG